MKADLIFGLGAVAFLIYALTVLIQGLINGEKLVALRFRVPFRVNRYLNPVGFWLYSAIDIIACIILAVFSLHFLFGIF